MSSERVTVADPPATPPDEVSERPPHKGWLSGKTAFFSAGFLLILLLLIWGLGSLITRRSGASHDQPSLSAQASTAARILRLKGTTEAIESRAILAPVLSGQQVGSLTITKLVSAGSHVKLGDLLVEFDRQAQRRDFLDKQAESTSWLARSPNSRPRRMQLGQKTRPNFTRRAVISGTRNLKSRRRSSCRVSMSRRRNSLWIKPRPPSRNSRKPSI